MQDGNSQKSLKKTSLVLLTTQILKRSLVMFVKTLLLAHVVLRFTIHSTKLQSNCCMTPDFSMRFLGYPAHEVTPHIILPI